MLDIPRPAPRHEGGDTPRRTAWVRRENRDSPSPRGGAGGGGVCAHVNHFRKAKKPLKYYPNDHFLREGREDAKIFYKLFKEFFFASLR